MFTLGPAASECEYRLSSLSVATTYPYYHSDIYMQNLGYLGEGEGESCHRPFRSLRCILYRHVNHSSFLFTECILQVLGQFLPFIHSQTSL